DGGGFGSNRVTERSWPGAARRLRLGQAPDLGAFQNRGRQRHVELVVTDLPASADDAPNRKVEPAGAPTDLDLLPVRQPESAFLERILQDHADILEVSLEIRRRREAEPEPDQLCGLCVQIEAAHH